MRILTYTVLCLLTVFALPLSGFAQTMEALKDIPLNDLNSFRDPGPNWTIASDAIADFTKEADMKPIAGKGALVNIVRPKGSTNLITKDEFGDLELDLDFMMAKHSNGGVYLQGRYEIQLFDSWTNPDPGFSDCGGIYQRWDDAKKPEGYQGIPPLINASRAPGLWQHLKIKFMAPVFNDKGEKIHNAHFSQVYLNGALIQTEADVTGPTRSSFYQDEKPLGPLMLQGDHGNVAFRNIRYRALKAPLPVNTEEADKTESTDDPILISTKNKPYLLRSYLNYGEKKLTHVISAGYPGQLNYSYDLKQGALLQVWRGEFLDVTEMWHERGEPQLAKPMGSLILLSDAPSLAVLADPDAKWPDSVSFDDFQNKGYTLDKNRFAEFASSFNNINATDKFSAAEATGIARTITVTDPPANLYHRLALAKRIEKLGKGLYAVDDKTYYIQIDEKSKVVIRQTAQGMEMIVPVSSANPSLTYSITW